MTAGQRRTVADVAAFLRDGPYDPLVPRAEVLADPRPCRLCGAGPGTECDGASPHPILTPMVLRDMTGVHLCRYQDVAHDPR